MKYTWKLLREYPCSVILLIFGIAFVVWASLMSIDYYGVIGSGYNTADFTDMQILDIRLDGIGMTEAQNTIYVTLFIGISSIFVSFCTYCCIKRDKGELKIRVLKKDRR